MGKKATVSLARPALALSGLGRSACGAASEGAAQAWPASRAAAHVARVGPQRRRAGRAHRAAAAHAGERRKGQGRVGGHAVGGPGRAAGSLREGPVGRAQVVGEPQRQCKHEEHVGHGQVEQVETQGLAQAPAAVDEHCQGRHVGRQPQARRQGVGCGHHNEASRVAPRGCGRQHQHPGPPLLFISDLGLARGREVTMEVSHTRALHPAFPHPTPVLFSSVDGGGKPGEGLRPEHSQHQLGMERRGWAPELSEVE